MSSSLTAEITLVIPLFNEEMVLPQLVKEIEVFRSARTESISVLFVDDGSSDSTFSLLRSLTESLQGYSAIRFSRNFGHQLAVVAGLKSCTANAAIVMDADLQDPLHVVGMMIDKWKEGFDVVYGVRDKRVGVSVTERLSARWFYRFFRWFTGVNTPVDAGDFRLISKPVIEAFNNLSEQQPFVRGLIAWLGFKQTSVHFERPPRAAGKTKYPMRKRFGLAVDGIMSFSVRPLKMAVSLGLIISAGSVLGLVWVVVTKYVIGTAITGWASLIFAAFFFGGLQLFFLGILGSYVARVYDEVKERPRYVVCDVWSSSLGFTESGSIPLEKSFDFTESVIET